MSAPDRVELSIHNARGGTSAASAGGRPLEERPPGPSSLYIEWRSQGLARVFEALKRLTRPLVRAIYLIPLLVVVKAIFYFTGFHGGHWITVGFVALVVTFFAVLALLALLFPLVGPRSGRTPRPELTLGRRDLDDALRLLKVPALPPTPTQKLEDLCRSEAQRARSDLRLRGRVRGTTGAASVEDAPLTDRWLARDNTVVRLVTGRVFFLELDGPPVIVDPGESPWILGDYRAGHRTTTDLPEEIEQQLSAWLTRQTGGALALEALQSDSTTAQIRAGDEVELFAARAEVVENVDELAVAGRQLRLGKETGAAPYRTDRSRRGLLATGTHQAPLVIKIL